MREAALFERYQGKSGGVTPGETGICKEKTKVWFLAFFSTDLLEI
jgi:hypothetical protein